MIKAPFPYFGGKSRVADEIWQRFGDVRNYVEPFFGSGAVLLSRPHAPQTETVNDFDGFLVNAWRSLKFAPEETAEWADWPVSEIDLEARHFWLITEGKARLETLLSNPEGYDAKIAGWWIWGACCWIGSSWCKGDGPWALNEEGRWFDRKLPHIGDAGQGVRIAAYFAALSARLERVRITHGDFKRVLGESVTIRHGVTAVFLDPPYLSKCDDVYTHSGKEPGRRAGEWCQENGDNPNLRIAICGYRGEYDLPRWTEYRWKANGGYSKKDADPAKDKSNRGTETIWFSPHCLLPAQETL
jgi:DNA adenine methylase